MSEFKVARAPETVQKEYQDAALRAGHLNYQLYALSRDLKVINDAMLELNLEFVAARKAAEEAAKALKEAEPAPSVTATTPEEAK